MAYSQRSEWEIMPSDVVRTYFTRALGTLETGQADTLAASLHYRGWKRGVDLRGIGDDMIDRTEKLARTALGALTNGRQSDARAALQEALELW